MREGLEKGKLRSVYNCVAKRYDFQHSFLTGWSDQRGRKLLVKNTVIRGDRLLDCGAGTGTTGLMAAQKAGRNGRVILFDMSAGMLEVAWKKAEQRRLQGLVEIMEGDMLNLPFGDNTFDAVLSTYSLCPVYDPVKGIKEIYRVTKQGGRIGVAHSTEPVSAAMKWLADKVENVVWRFPSISLGCRSVSVLPILQNLGCKTIFKKHIGLPFLPFFVFVVIKPQVLQNTASVRDVL